MSSVAAGIEIDRNLDLSINGGGPWGKHAVRSSKGIRRVLVKTI